MRTSYSAIETYLQCPQKFKFQEIDRIRVPKSKEAIFGTLIHATLKFMFQRDPLFPTLEEVVAYFRAHWPAPDIFIQETAHDSLKRTWSDEEQKIYFEEGVRMLKKFYEKNAPWNYSVIDLESRFEIALTDEKNGQTHILAGIIDRIDKLPDGSYEIIDYKTTKRMPSQHALNNNLQLSLYSLGLQRRWPHLQQNDIKLSLYFVKHGEKLTAETPPDQTEKTKNHILETIRDIEERRAAQKPFEPMPSALCNWCGYRPLCPAWKHLYKNQKIEIKNENEINKTIQEYFEMKKKQHEYDTKLKALQADIKAYMAEEGVTRVFGDEGIIAQKTVQWYQYDQKKIKAVLEPLGRWEEILKMDDTKLRRLLKEVSEDIRNTIQDARHIAKEYTILTASLKKILTKEL